MEDDRSRCGLRRVRTGEVEVRGRAGESVVDVDESSFFSSCLVVLVLTVFADWNLSAAARCWWCSWRSSRMRMA
jgi:hypothetical protein